MGGHLFGKTQTVQDDLGLRRDRAFVEFGQGCVRAGNTHIVFGFSQGFFGCHEGSVA